MNWKNVYRLMQIERKAGRMLRGVKATGYHENRVFANLSFLLFVVIGVAVGFFAWVVVNSFAIDEIQTVATGVFAAFPTFVLVISAVFTVLFQIQRSGVRMQAEAPYWLPITWQEHTLASVFASLLGVPLYVVLLIVSAILVFAVFTGLIILAVMTSVAIFAAAFLSSVFMEVLRVLQVRFTGAIYKSSGRGAIWVRFVGSLTFLLIFFIGYFSVIYRSVNLFSILPEVQNSLFYIPFVWPGLMISNFFSTSGSVLLGVIYMFLTVVFICGMYVLAVLLNKRFGLYEPPAIRIQKSGLYTPKTGVLGKFGFSTNEAALMRKDFKAFTRRRELMTVFISPVIFVLIPLMQSLGGSSEVVLYNAGMVYLLPAVFMVMMLGTLIIGEEGQAIWRIYASPISAKNLVKSKYFFTVFFGLMMLVITGVIGTLLYRSSTTIIVVGVLEAFFLTIALSAISLHVGFIGADFTEVPRPRMVRQSWVFINMVACAFTGFVILIPLLPIVISSMLGSMGYSFPSFNPFVATAISGVIAVVIAGVFYKLLLNRAKEFLCKAEV
ncbi:MAG: hypothetical protein FWH37_00530 [Candidatus Bathyarchaeota archaeon]|nr:hypothetical protein [Candidatus Termiticorpusculum sp.]